VSFLLSFTFSSSVRSKPNRKNRKNFGKGDQVVTIGGLHGRVYAVEDAQVVLEVDRGVKLTFEKSAISQEASVKTAATTKAE
jgi:preprotein translocase subunit YajC